MILLKCLKLGTEEWKQHEYIIVFRDPGLASRGHCDWITHSLMHRLFWHMHKSLSWKLRLFPVFMLHFFQAIGLSRALTPNSATAISIHSFGSPKQILWLKNMLEHYRRQPQAELCNSFIVYFKWRILGLEHNISGCGYYMLCVQTSWHDLCMYAIALTYTICQTLVKTAVLLLAFLHTFPISCVYFSLDFFEDEIISYRQGLERVMPRGQWWTTLLRWMETLCFQWEYSMSVCGPNFQTW